MARNRWIDNNKCVWCLRVAFANQRAADLHIEGVLTCQELQALWDAQQARCMYTGAPISIQNAHLDHIQPLALGGQNTLSNVVFISSFANLSKNDQPLETWCSGQGLDLAAILDEIESLHHWIGADDDWQFE